MNEENLIPAAHKLTVEDQSKGGKASAESRRRKKNIRQIAEMSLHLPPDSDGRKSLEETGIKLDEDANHWAVIIAGLTKQAEEGDTKAVRTLMDIVGADYYKNEYLKLRKEELNLKKKKLEEDNWT